MLRTRRMILLALIFLGQVFLAGCGGGDSGEESSKTDLNMDNPLISISTIRNISIDQFSFYLTSKIYEPNLEVWIKDADSGKLLLCSYSGFGMQGVSTEGIFYGNLKATFQKMISEADNYEGRLFEVWVHHSNDNSVCLNVGEGGIIAGDLVIGNSGPVTYNTLISEPIFATNGTFFVRFKETAETMSRPLPFSIVASMPKDRLMIDQIYVSDLYSPDNWNADPEVYILAEVSKPAEGQDGDDETKTWEMIGCADADTGLGSFGSRGMTYSKLLADIVDENSTVISFSKNTGKTVKIVMIDNDVGSCPQPSAVSESVIGESEPVLWDDLPGKRIWMENNLGYITFNNVVR